VAQRSKYLQQQRVARLPSTIPNASGFVAPLVNLLSFFDHRVYLTHWQAKLATESLSLK
jgi:hypothetical protein